MDFKLKKNSPLLFILLLICFISYKYFDYHKKANYLENLYKNGGVGIEADIYSYFSLIYEITGDIPKRKAIEEFLPKLSKSFFEEHNYSLVIDSLKKEILLYSFGPSKSNNNLNNKIDLRLFSNKDDDYLQGFTFYNYLLNGDYDILLFDGTLKYDCNDFLDYKPLYYTSSDSIVFKDEKLNTKLNSILKESNLNTGFTKDFSKSTIYIYDGKELKRKCFKKQHFIGKEKEERLFDLIKENFPKFNYMKFSVTPAGASLSK